MKMPAPCVWGRPVLEVVLLLEDSQELEECPVLEGIFQCRKAFQCWKKVQIYLWLQKTGKYHHCKAA